LPSKVIELDFSMELILAFSALLQANLLSAPVWDKETKQYTGFLDVKDMVAATLHTAKAKVEDGSFLTKAVEKHVEDNPSIKYLSRRSPFRPVRSSSSLLEVAHLLSQRYHRVPVVEKDKCVGIVSQSTLIAFLAEHKESLSEDLSQTLEDVKLGLKSVVTVSESSTAHEAFSLIEKSWLSGVGVVDEEGKLIGNTSARDIKALVYDKGQKSLDDPIVDYLAKVRQGQSKEKDRAAVTMVRKTDSLGRVIGLLGKTQYHRLFIVDPEGKPIGVVSISDVFAFASHEPKQAEAKQGEAKLGEAKDAAKEVSKEAPKEGAARGVDAVKDVAQDVAKDAAKDVAKGPVVEGSPSAAARE